MTDVVVFCFLSIAQGYMTDIVVFCFLSIAQGYMTDIYSGVLFPVYSPRVYD